MRKRVKHRKSCRIFLNCRIYHKLLTLLFVTLLK